MAAIPVLKHYTLYKVFKVIVPLEQEEKARADLEADDELLNEASSKLNYALSSTPLKKHSFTVAQMMLETAKTNCQQAMDSWIR